MWDETSSLKKPKPSQNILIHSTQTRRMYLFYIFSLCVVVKLDRPKRVMQLDPLKRWLKGKFKSDLSSFLSFLSLSLSLFLKQNLIMALQCTFCCEVASASFFLPSQFFFFSFLVHFHVLFVLSCQDYRVLYCRIFFSILFFSRVVCFVKKRAFDSGDFFPRIIILTWISLV